MRVRGAGWITWRWKSWLRVLRSFMLAHAGFEAAHYANCYIEPQIASDREKNHACSLRGLSRPLDTFRLNSAVSETTQWFARRTGEAMSPEAAVHEPVVAIEDLGDANTLTNNARGQQAEGNRGRT